MRPKMKATKKPNPKEATPPENIDWADECQSEVSDATDVMYVMNTAPIRRLATVEDAARDEEDSKSIGREDDDDDDFTVVGRKCAEIFVGNVPQDVGCRQLAHVFKRFGPVKGLKLFVRCDGDEDSSPSFAHITFETATSAEAARTACIKFAGIHAVLFVAGRVRFHVETLRPRPPPPAFKEGRPKRYKRIFYWPKDAATRDDAAWTAAVKAFDWRETATLYLRGHYKVEDALVEFVWASAQYRNVDYDSLRDLSEMLVFLAETFPKDDPVHTMSPFVAGYIFNIRKRERRCKRRKIGFDVSGVLKTRPDLFRIDGDYVDYVDIEGSRADAKRQFRHLLVEGVLLYFIDKVLIRPTLMIKTSYYESREPIRSALALVCGEKDSTKNALRILFKSVFNEAFTLSEDGEFLRFSEEIVRLLHEIEEEERKREKKLYDWFENDDDDDEEQQEEKNENDQVQEEDQQNEDKDDEQVEQRGEEEKLKVIAFPSLSSSTSHEDSDESGETANSNEIENDNSIVYYRSFLDSVLAPVEDVKIVPEAKEYATMHPLPIGMPYSVTSVVQAVLRDADLDGQVDVGCFNADTLIDASAVDGCLKRVTETFGNQVLLKSPDQIKVEMENVLRNVLASMLG